MLDVPTQPVPDTQPVLERLQLQYDEQQGRVLYLEGRNFGTNLDDLEVNFHLGGKVYPGTILAPLSQPEQERIAVTTDFVPLAEAEVSLKRTTHSVIDTQTETETERVKIPIDGCVEMAMVPRQTSDTISLVNTLNPEQVIAQTDSKDLLLADIPVGSPNREDGPRAIAATSNASRAYVTLNKSAQVALVDLTAFKQLDAQPNVEGINGIDLPSHAIPSAIAIDSRDEYAYVADWKTGAIYVIDINPSSDFYNQYIGTIEVENASLGLRQLAMSSDGTRLFATTPGGSDTGRGQILVFNIDPRDRPDNPADPNQNTRKWHQQIGRVEGGYGVEGLAATYDPTKMVFTSRGEEPKGYGVLTILNNDPLSFEAVTHYAQLTLGGLTDYFDVNEAVSVAVMYDEESGTDYAFVAGRNGRMIGSGIESVDGSKAGGNIGIIKDALGPNPTLVAATRPIPNGFTNGVSLSSDNKYLTASYPGIDSTFVFNVKEMLQTVNSTPLEVFEEKPIDDINPSISLAADFKDIGNAIDSFTRKIPYGVPNNSHTGPISLGGGSPFSVATASSRPIVNLQNPIGVFDEETLTPTFKWNFNGEGDETDVCATPVDEDDVKEVRLYVSVFPEGEGLLPRDIWPELDSPTPGRDYNPNRILTATWKEGVWTWNGGSQAGAKDQFTLPDDRMLTAGQEYYWAVEAVINGSPTPVVEDSQFKTPLPPSPSSSPFTSVTVLTRGVEPQNDEEHNRLLNSQINALASKIQEAGGSVMKYNPSTGGWQSVTLNGNSWVATNTTPIEEKPLVLLADWMQGLDASSFYNGGFAEAAADSMFASLVKLDQQYGGKVGEGSGLYDANGNLIRTQGDIFNSPLHFIGLGQGAVVNTEMIQRLGTYFPNAGGTNASNRDLQMTTIDPYDYDPTFPEPVFSTVLDPEVVVWDNVTYADNYSNPKSFVAKIHKNIA
ncbi:YncE family protein [Oxynema aestuarii]|uniref:Uncharacterized protein n=1 Tax=Oxynema aestuarii AP17 TaxID=2064643 RepID=A0A6H1U2C6_9CYAN|nr:hypothetical protein [Oxynema aestuarii]QIZ73028.1 hypothetical protein HCG48_22495 [Oxynema aestuarii AP17]